MSNIKDFLSAAADKRPTDAYDAFSAEMTDRISNLLADKKLEITSSVFNPGEREDE